MRDSFSKPIKFLSADMVKWKVRQMNNEDWGESTFHNKLTRALRRTLAIPSYVGYQYLIRRHTLMPYIYIEYWWETLVGSYVKLGIVML